ncbi:TIGR00725 family protein [bacterium]|nr:TIGR00725 family protein [bacterium]MBU1064803.1 TIGR00725 family protein [bacterium]MBU1634058.1 TIGR00725 family protein [bacterium]MBU1872299.1 TIGR00725 family protein [bacterium]
MSKKIIAVIGGRSCTDAQYQIAREVGRHIAENNAVLVCGGRTGIMEAACRGAAEAGGITVGILPGDDSRDANDWVTVPIATGIGLARNAIIIRSASAAIAIGGSYGTLSEIAYCKQFGVPVYGIQSWDIEGIPSIESPEEAVRLAFDTAKSD